MYSLLQYLLIHIDRIRMDLDIPPTHGMLGSPLAGYLFRVQPLIYLPFSPEFSAANLRIWSWWIF